MKSFEVIGLRFHVLPTEYVGVVQTMNVGVFFRVGTREFGVIFHDYGVRLMVGRCHVTIRRISKGLVA